jgi:hypothetical protein
MKSRIEIQKRCNIAEERLNKLEVKTTEDKYYELSYIITIKTLNSILDENKDEAKVSAELDKVKAKVYRLQKSGNQLEILKNNLEMRTYNWVLNDSNNVEIEWAPLKFKN